MYISEIETYRKEGSTDEWFVSALIDKCTVGLSPGRAYSEIESAFTLLLAEDEWDIFLIHCRYISRLVRLANTTQMPEILQDNLARLNSKISQLGLGNRNEVSELYTWYRLNT